MYKINILTPPFFLAEIRSKIYLYMHANGNPYG